MTMQKSAQELRIEQLLADNQALRKNAPAYPIKRTQT